MFVRTSARLMNVCVHRYAVSSIVCSQPFEFFFVCDGRTSAGFVLELMQLFLRGLQFTVSPVRFLRALQVTVSPVSFLRALQFTVSAVSFLRALQVTVSLMSFERNRNASTGS